MTEFDNKKPSLSQNQDRANISNKNSDNKTISDNDQELKAETGNADQKNLDNESILKNPVANPIWLSISEAAKLGGVNTKTIRRAIQSEKIKYKIYKNRYLIGLKSLILYLNSNTKLKNKLIFNGIGQYIKGSRK
jgi:hypothetical protein